MGVKSRQRHIDHIINLLPGPERTSRELATIRERFQKLPTSELRDVHNALQELATKGTSEKFKNANTRARDLSSLKPLLAKFAEFNETARKFLHEAGL